MTEDRKLQEIVELLLKKTRTGEIAWENALPDGNYITSFSTHSVKIGPIQGTSVPVLSVLNDMGARISQASGSVAAAPPGTLTSKVSELYRGIRESKQKTELDKLLEELREAS